MPADRPDPAHGAFCRSCRTGFPEGTEWCEACGRKLNPREEADPEAMVVLRAFPGGVEAAWARSALEARGIPSRLDAASSQFGSGAYMKARLFVPAGRLDEARSILADAEDVPAEPESKPASVLAPDHDGEELSRRRRVRYLRVLLGVQAVLAISAAYFVDLEVGGRWALAESIVAAAWALAFIVSLLSPRAGFATAMALGLALLLLSAAAAWFGPETREPPPVVLLRCLFVGAMYWGWRSSKKPEP